MGLIILQKPRKKLKPIGQRIIGVVGSSLISYLRLADTSGGTAADASGNSRTAAYTLVTLNNTVAGWSHVVPSWNGTTSFCNWYTASLAAAFNGQEGTLMLWGQVSGVGVWTDATLRYLCGLRVDAGTNIATINRTATNGQVAFNYMNRFVNYASGSPLGVVNYAMTWSVSANQFKAYANGVQTGATQTGFATWAGSLASNRCGVGCALSSASSVWSGNLGDVFVASRALSAAEIASIYAGGKA